ncbi:haloacid dehalogenase [Nakamurella endophytica]|uniref:Haloacid dehalogenase n=1 Tax=Nakamurella endophytica TaxID=1748367 RepID=A0A917SS91_9ACTN|nr:haloacid dehalogenase [Nakamurella endophytica]
MTTTGDTCAPADGGDTTTELAGVLFDMDGTLTDSERLWTISLAEVAAAYGGTISVETREAMVGQDMWTTIDLLHAEIGVQVDPAETARRLTEATREVFARGLPWKPGARELLAAVRAAGLRTALVTATHRPLVDIALRTLGSANFDAVVAGDEVVRNKPDPEPYLRGVELLGLPADRCLAIEDSPAGSTSAAAAGLPVLVVPSEMPVAAAPGLFFADSLVDIDVPQLRRLRARPRPGLPVG